MLTLTPDATTAIRELLSSAPLSDSGGLRIATTRHDDGRAGLALALVDQPGAADEVVESDEARVFLEPEAAAALDDKTLDVQASIGEDVTFVITPQA